MQQVTSANNPAYSAIRLKDLVNKVRTQLGKVKSFAVLTSNRGNLTPEENSNNLNIVKRLLGVMGLNWRQVIGYGQEEGGTVKEPSFAIPGISLAQAQYLWKRFDQWGIVYVGPETHGEVMLLGHDQANQDDNALLGEAGLVTPTTQPENWTEIPKGTAHHDTSQGSGYGIANPWDRPAGTVPGYPNPFMKGSSMLGIVTAALDPIAEPDPKELSPAAGAKSPDALNPTGGDHLFYTYLIPGSVWQALDGSQWKLDEITPNGLYYCSNWWYPRERKMLSRDELRRSIESWVDPVLQHVPPPRPEDLQQH